MSDDRFDKIEAAGKEGGASAAVDELIRTLDADRDFHRLFDALLLKTRVEMGLPVSRPASFDDVPESQQAPFEEAYMAAARRVGTGLLADGNIPQAWAYFRTIREHEPVVSALDAVPAEGELPANVDELIAVALYERAHPTKGLELMLRSRGTCNTVSSFDQALSQISAEERTRGAALLVRHLYTELLHSVRRDVERRTGVMNESADLRGTLALRDDLFDEGNYHIDVSHLGAVVRFARFLEPGSPELALAIQLAEYGGKLASQFQYPSDPPFDDYYAAHRHFFRILAGEEREASLGYFRDRVPAAEDPEDRRLIAYVLVDLLVRTGDLAQATELAERELADLDESSGFSLAQLCEKAGRMDVAARAARARGDLVGYTAALLRNKSS